MIVSTAHPATIPLRRRLGRIVRLGDDGEGWTGEGYGSTINYADVTGGYSNLASDSPPPDYSSIGAEPANETVGYDPNLQAQAEDTGLTLTAQGTALAPTTGESTPSSTLINWGDDLSSFMNNLLGPPVLATTPIVGTSGASTASKVSTPATTTKPVAASLPKATPSKPPKANNYPNVAAYEALFAANLNGFLASGRTNADKVAGENYFTQEWAIFAADMGSAGSWGTTGLAQRNRGGSLDWWAKYYDPIANATTTGTGATSSGVGSLFSGSNSGLLWLVVAGVIVWWMTE